MADTVAAMTTDDPGAALADRLVQGPDAAAESAPGDHLVLDLASGRYYGLGEAGGFIWQALDGERRLGEVAAAVVERYGVKRARAEADVLEFAAELLAAGLARRVAG